MREETEQVLFQGIEAAPLIHYETAAAAVHQEDLEPQLWTINDVKQEHHTIKIWVSSETPEDGEKKKAIPSPSRDHLLRLLDWGAPNCWDFHDRLWVYMDAPHNHPDIGITTDRHSRASRVMVATLVNCPHERQYLPDMNVAWYGAIAAMWATKQGHLIDSTGNFTSPSHNTVHDREASMLLPRYYERGSNDAVWQLSRMWQKNVPRPRHWDTPGPVYASWRHHPQ